MDTGRVRKYWHQAEVRPRHVLHCHPSDVHNLRVAVRGVSLLCGDVTASSCALSMVSLRLRYSQRGIKWLLHILAQLVVEYCSPSDARLRYSTTSCTKMCNNHFIPRWLFVCSCPWWTWNIRDWRPNVPDRGNHGKSSKSVQCAISGPRLRMRHRPLA